jgi:hypothetical protein
LDYVLPELKPILYPDQQFLPDVIVKPERSIELDESAYLL